MVQRPLEREFYMVKILRFNFEIKNNNIDLLTMGTSDSQYLVVILNTPDVFFPKWNYNLMTMSSLKYKYRYSQVYTRIINYFTVFCCICIDWKLFILKLVKLIK